MRLLPSAALALLAASSATVQPETSGDTAGRFKDVRGSSAKMDSRNCCATSAQVASSGSEARDITVSAPLESARPTGSLIPINSNFARDPFIVRGYDHGLPRNLRRGPE
jgi:hypothetical protein